MAWSTIYGRRYYYHHVQRNGCASVRYLGRGPEAELAALALERRKAEVHRDREKARQRAAELRRLDDELGRLHAEATLIYAAALQRLGWRRHHREWRVRACR